MRVSPSRGQEPEWGPATTAVVAGPTAVRILALVATAVCCLTACDTVREDGLGEPSQVPGIAHEEVDRQAVVRPSPEATDGEQSGETAPLTPEQARELASAFADRFIIGPSLKLGSESLRQSIEQRYGTAIDYERLSIQALPILVISPFESFPDRVPETLQRWLGSWYIVQFNDGPSPVFTVAVSASLKHLSPDSLRHSGRVRLRGNEFRVLGTPADDPYTVPLSAQQAIAIARGLSPDGVVEPPRPFRAALPPEFPQLVRWQVILNTPICLRDFQDHSIDPHRELFLLSHSSAGGGGTQVAYFVRARLAPQGLVQYPSHNDDPDYLLPVATGRPAKFRRVEPVVGPSTPECR